MQAGCGRLRGADEEDSDDLSRGLRGADEEEFGAGGGNEPRAARANEMELVLQGNSKEERAMDDLALMWHSWF